MPSLSPNASPRWGEDHAGWSGSVTVIQNTRVKIIRNLGILIENSFSSLAWKLLSRFQSSLGQPESAQKILKINGFGESTP